MKRKRLLDQIETLVSDASTGDRDNKADAFDKIEGLLFPEEDPWEHDRYGYRPGERLL